MPIGPRRLPLCVGILAILATALGGCTPLGEYIHNGFKVGPNYGRPAAPVAQNWIDADDPRVKVGEDNLCGWWGVFHDRALDALICNAYHQNLSLKAAGFRVLEARSQLGIDTGNLFPQTQQGVGSYTRTAVSQHTVQGLFTPTPFYSNWNFGFTMAWELDFWGQFRRIIESDNANLDASVELYDAALVTLLGDVATNYANMRTLEQRIVYAKNNAEIQRETLTIVEARFRASTTSELDVDQARSTLYATEAAIPELEISLRQAINQLCIDMGIPPEDLRKWVGPAPIPVAPQDVVIGVPADLLRRRPDVRAAERQAAAQCALIGVAEANFYPHISIDGTIGTSAEEFKGLFTKNSMAGTVGPSFQWNLLNYGRIKNNVLLQNAKFQELVATYQNTVLTANQDVENGLVTFLKAQQRTKLQQQSVDDADKAVKVALVQYKAGTIDFTRVTQVEQDLVLEQDTLAQAQGEIATGLIQVYRALGGGWQIRLTDCNAPPIGPGTPPLPIAPPAETVPTPAGQGAPGHGAAGQGTTSPSSPANSSGQQPNRNFGPPATPGQPHPDPSAPGQPLPLQAPPAQPMPNQPMSNHILPNQAVPNQAVPNQFAPSEPIPNQPMQSQPPAGQTDQGAVPARFSLPN